METIVRCDRCGKPAKDITKMVKMHGLTVGPECAVVVEETFKRTGLTGDELKALVRQEYAELMRQKSVEGMIAKGMLPANFWEQKQEAEAAKLQRKADREAKKAAKVTAVVEPVKEEEEPKTEEPKVEETTEEKPLSNRQKKKLRKQQLANV